MHCVDIGDCTENAQSAITGPGLSFNFHSSKINFFENCDAHFIGVKIAFPKNFAFFPEQASQAWHFAVFRLCM